MSKLRLLNPEDVPEEARAELRDLLEAITTGDEGQEKIRQKKTRQIVVAIEAVSDALESYPKFTEMSDGMQDDATKIYNACSHLCAVYMALLHDINSQ